MLKIWIIIFSSFALFCSAQTLGKITLSTEKIKNTYFIYGENNEDMPMSVVFKFTLVNMKSSVDSDKPVVIPPRSSRNLLAIISLIQESKAYSYKYSSLYNFGDVTRKIYDQNYIYELPFEKSKSYMVYQGYNGKLSHENQSALDFSLKVGDKVFAAREGTVVSVIENFDTRCATSDCAKFNNKILILHSDGTFAEYLHLMKNGAEVEIGDKIERGQFIGYSGNTGWSTGPHLHFAVFFNRMGGNRDYIPTLFKTEKPTGEFLSEKKIYTKTE